MCNYPFLYLYNSRENLFVCESISNFIDIDNIVEENFEHVEANAEDKIFFSRINYEYVHVDNTVEARSTVLQSGHIALRIVMVTTYYRHVPLYISHSQFTFTLKGQQSVYSHQLGE